MTKEEDNVHGLNRVFQREELAVGEDPVDEASIGPGPAKLKSIPISDEQKQELKQAQSRRRGKPVRPKTGMRVLFVSFPDASIHDGTVKEVSGSGTYIHLVGEFSGKPWGRWVERDHVLEELEDTE
jgi:hypothetical protein